MHYRPRLATGSVFRREGSRRRPEQAHEGTRFVLGRQPLLSSQQGVGGPCLSRWVSLQVGLLEVVTTSV